MDERAADWELLRELLSSITRRPAGSGTAETVRDRSSGDASSWRAPAVEVVPTLSSAGRFLRGTVDVAFMYGDEEIPRDGEWTEGGNNRALDESDPSPEFARDGRYERKRSSISRPETGRAFWKPGGTFRKWSGWNVNARRTCCHAVPARRQSPCS